MACLSIACFAELILRVCSWAAQIRLSVSCFSSPDFNHCHLLSSFSFSVSVRNFSCKAFSFQLSSLSFFGTFYYFFL